MTTSYYHPILRPATPLLSRMQIDPRLRLRGNGRATTKPRGGWSRIGLTVKTIRELPYDFQPLAGSTIGYMEFPAKTPSEPDATKLRKFFGGEKP